MIKIFAKLISKKKNTLSFTEETSQNKEDICIYHDPNCEYEIIERVIKPEMRRCDACGEMTPIGLDYCVRCGTTIKE